MVLTEDLGKMFEMAICLLYNTPYSGNYKYGLDGPNIILPKIQKLLDYFPACTHTADKGSRYDFTSSDGKFLSAKTTSEVEMKNRTKRVRIEALIGISIQNLFWRSNCLCGREGFALRHGAQRSLLGQYGPWIVRHQPQARCSLGSGSRSLVYPASARTLPDKLRRS